MDDIEITEQGWLSDGTFSQVVAHTPLVALDFVVTNSRGEWLLGLRRNRPAQGYWFVPGGRVRKNESLAAAARRLTNDELGRPRALGSMRFLGVYEHFYVDSMLSSDISTHYVVHAYHFELSTDIEMLPRHQHDSYLWWAPEGIRANSAVHPNTRAYLSTVSELVPPLSSQSLSYE